MKNFNHSCDMFSGNQTYFKREQLRTLPIKFVSLNYVDRFINSNLGNHQAIRQVVMCNCDLKIKKNWQSEYLNLAESSKYSFKNILIQKSSKSINH